MKHVVYSDKWAASKRLTLFLLYPLFDREAKVFTPICSSEIPAYERDKKDFSDAGCDVIHCTYDTGSVHKKFVSNHLDKHYRRDVTMMSVPKKYRKKLFGNVIDNIETETRSWVLFDADKNEVVAYGRNPLNVARNIQCHLQMVLAYNTEQICTVSDLPRFEPITSQTT